MTLQLATAGVNVLRDNHWVRNPVSGLYERSTLLEGQRTNAWTKSQECDDVSWTKTRASVTANAATAPDGTATADKLVEDTTAATSHYIGKAPASTPTDSTIQSVTFYLKAGERTWAKVSVIGKDGADRGAWFNLAAGTVGTKDAGVTATVRWYDAASGWCRCEVNATCATGGATTTGRVWICNADLTTSTAGDGASGIYAWGGQFEVDQPCASSYIPTTTATVTRSADNVYRDLPAALITPQALTVYQKFIEQGTILSPLDTRLFVIGAGSGAAPRFDLRRSSSPLYIGRHDNGTTTVQANLAVAPAVGDLVEIALSIDATTLKIEQSINGAAKTTSSVAANSFAANWSDTRLWVNSINGGVASGFIALLSLKLARGAKTLEQMRAF